MNLLILASAVQLATAPAAAGVPSLVQSPDTAPRPVAAYFDPVPDASVVADSTYGTAPKAGTRLSRRPGGTSTTRPALDPRSVLEARRDEFDRR